jgi:UDP-4-amino-4,6-dideoxy-N-acetyl-beta-L-altrosamine transaminase
MTLSEKSDRPSIPYGRQDIDDDDIAAVVAVLKSDYLTQGPVVGAFERQIAERVGARHAVASNSATSSLHLACLALGVGPGDTVWTSPITFVASANCARYCGAAVDFVDIDARTSNISVDRLAEKLAAAEKSGRLPKVVIPVHMGGHPADLAGIAELAQHYGFKVVEDASHAIGGSYRGEPIGNCRYSDITVFSFHPVKIITSGEGGVAVTNDSELARRMARLNSHGITRNPSEMSKAPDGPWYYEQVELGYNYRLTDIHAALGLSQLQRIDEYVQRRQALGRRYDSHLADLPAKIPFQDERDSSALHLYVIRLELDRISATHRTVFERLRADNILVNLHYIPVYRQPDFAGFGFDPADFPAAERYYAEAISLPMFPRLTEEDQDYVVASLAKALG